MSSNNKSNSLTEFPHNLHSLNNSNNQENFFICQNHKIFNIKNYTSFPFLFIFMNSSNNSPLYNSNDKNNILKESITKNFYFFKNLNYQDFISGITGGIISTSVLHPLDLLKIRLAVNDGQTSTKPTYHGLKNAFKKIKSEEGIKGFYRGVMPNCLGAGAAWGFYFLFYNAFKVKLMKEKNSEISFGHHMLAAAEAGIVSLIITNPLWVVKTRLCLQYGNLGPSKLPISKQYNGMIDTFRKIYKYEGLRGFYKGFIPGILGVSHGSIQFMVYEEFKKYYKKKYNKKSNSEFKFGELLSFLIVSKMCAAIFTYPFQVIRARLQDQHSSYEGVIDAIKKIYKNERLTGYFKGFLPNLIRILPANVITLMVYEQFKNYFERINLGT